MKDTFDLEGTNEFVCATDCGNCAADACWVGKEVKPGSGSEFNMIPACSVPIRSPDFDPGYDSTYM